MAVAWRAEEIQDRTCPVLYGHPVAYQRILVHRMISYSKSAEGVK